jgi:hypothetical protein
MEKITLLETLPPTKGRGKDKELEQKITAGETQIENIETLYKKRS